MRYLRLLLSIAVVAGLVLIATLFNQATSNIEAPAGLEVSFFDVGQGDSIFIESPSGFRMLVDGGPDASILEHLGQEMAPSDKKIDLLVLTHPHADHLTGLVEVLKRYNVGQILSTDAVHTSPFYLEWLKLIKEKNIPVELSKDVAEINLGAGAKAEVWYPKISFREKAVENLNSTSIVLRLEYAGISFLLTGDLEEKEQRKLLKMINAKPDSSFRATFLKVPHHGSKKALDEQFLKAVSPRIAIISVGENSYGHPSALTLEKLTKAEIQIKRTDQEGTIKVKVDKEGRWKIN